MTRAIAASGLVKSFGGTRALDGLDLTVHRGEVHGLLGPNGAGKTTLIRILLGLTRADGGTARLLGGDPWADAPALHRHVAYVPGDVTLWPGLTGGEVIDVIGALRGGLDGDRRNELIGRFDLDPRERCRNYPPAERRKVALVAALASDAELLVLDEPALGLDLVMERTFRRVVLEEQARANRTFLLSSHILSEVDALCDGVSIIRDGRTVESGVLAEMRLGARTSISAQLLGRPFALAHMTGVHNVTVRNNHVECDVDHDSIEKLMRYLASVGIRDLVSREPTLEELFLRHYGAHRPRRPNPARTPAH